MIKETLDETLKKIHKFDNENLLKEYNLDLRDVVYLSQLKYYISLKYDIYVLSQRYNEKYHHTEFKKDNGDAYSKMKTSIERKLQRMGYITKDYNPGLTSEGIKIINQINIETNGTLKEKINLNCSKNDGILNLLSIIAPIFSPFKSLINKMKKIFILILTFSFLGFSTSVFASCDFSNSIFEQERNESYFRACNKGIITESNITSAKMDKELTRIEMARMLNIFSMEIMGKEEDPSKNCNGYSDLKNSNDISTASRACHLGIMGIGIDKFRPNDSVSRAEFGTVLSRILYGDKYNVTEGEFYKLHLKALKDNGIITNDNPNIKEMKGYVLLMLKRYIDRVEKENKSIEDAITFKNNNGYVAILGNDVIFSNFKDTITVSNDFTHIPYGKWSNSLQGPCAPGYHVPSKDEAIELVNIWSYIRKDDLDNASITSGSVVQNDYDKLKDKGAGDMFLSDIYGHEVKAAAGTERTSFRTRSKYSEYSPYSIQVVTSQVNVSYMACGLGCELRVLCFKTK